MSLDSILFGQSSLFVSDKNIDKNASMDVDILELEFGSSLLAGSTTERDVGNNQDKEVVLNDGTSFRLELKKKKKPVDIDLLAGGDSYMNTQELFNRVEHRKILKESNKRVKDAENQERRASVEKSPGAQLWTESYRPSSFVQLCSAGNDKQYRLILHWLKKWSSVVFGEEFVANETVDPLGRPHRKVLLLHGPSGIGKTVAAQVLALQLGYSVQELNAANSMDTLPQSNTSGALGYSSVSKALRLKIMNALTSNTIDSNGKPSCLVIDEIDSSMNSGDIIRVLSDLVQQDQRTMNRKYYHNNISNEAESKNKKKGGKDFILNRPIICIANDIYSSSSSRHSTMDKLRPICEIIALKKPSYTKNASGIKNSGNALRSVKDHLMRINLKEGLGLDYQEIGEIVEVCDADIRASINYLQFNGRKISLPECFQNSKSDKYNMDSQLSWFAMVDMLFKRYSHLSKDENFDRLFDSMMNGSGKSAISSGSLFDKVIKGCFNRYLDVVHYQDDSLIRPAEFSDWLSFYDNNAGQSNVDYYAGLVGMKIWSLFSEIDHNRIKREESLIPNAKNLDFEAYELQKQNTTIIRRVAEKIPIATKLALGGSVDSHGNAAYFIPYLDLLLGNVVGPSTSSKITEFDKTGIKKVAFLIKSFDMKLESHRDLETNQISLEISPNWSTITNYDNIMAPIPSAVVKKQLQIKRQWLFPLIKAELERLSITKNILKRPLNVKQSSPDKEEKRAKISSSIEFFKGKYDGINTQIQSSTRRSENHEATRIWVKYHEGFSNAVRKNIGWADLWA